MLITYCSPFKDRFRTQILDDIKIHTLRKDPNDRWKPGMKISHWYGNPRNVKQNPYCFKDQDLALQLERVIIRSNRGESLSIRITDFNNPNRKRWLQQHEIDQFAKSDGLTPHEMAEYFVPRSFDMWMGVLIGWTNFSYIPENWTLQSEIQSFLMRNEVTAGKFADYLQKCGSSNSLTIDVILGIIMPESVRDYNVLLNQMEMIDRTKLKI